MDQRDSTVSPSDEELKEYALSVVAQTGTLAGVKWALRLKYPIGSSRAKRITKSIERRVLGEAPEPKTPIQAPTEAKSPDGFAPLPFRVGVWDLEVSHLRSDLGTLIVSAFLDYHTGEIECKTILDFGGGEDAEKLLLEWTVEQYHSYDILIGQNSKAFDKNFLNGVLARYSLPFLRARFHIDTYEVARYGMKGLLSSSSLDGLAQFFGVDEQKDKPNKSDWRRAFALDEKSVKRIAERCISDVRVTALIFDKLKPYWHKWKGIQ